MDIIAKIKWLEYEIMEEIQGAKAYMNCASMWEKTDGEISKMFSTMARQEMEHAEHLNTIVTRIMRTHISADDLARLPELMQMINREQITEAKSYIPEADPEVVVKKV